MKKHEPKYIEVEGIMRACYDSFLKTGNKAYREIFALVEAVPAADVQEVRHGRWLQPYHNKQYKKCSVCESVFSVNLPKNANYCPNCGAKMDEVEE